MKASSVLKREALVSVVAMSIDTITIDMRIEDLEKALHSLDEVKNKKTRDVVNSTLRLNQEIRRKMDELNFSG